MYTFNDDTNIHISPEQWQHMVSRIESGIHTPEYFEHESITVDGYGAILQLLYAARSGYVLVKADNIIQNLELAALELSQAMVKQESGLDEKTVGYLAGLSDMLDAVRKEVGEFNDN